MDDGAVTAVDAVVRVSEPVDIDVVTTSHAMPPISDRAVVPVGHQGSDTAIERLKGLFQIEPKKISYRRPGPRQNAGRGDQLGSKIIGERTCCEPCDLSRGVGDDVSLHCPRRRVRSKAEHPVEALVEVLESRAPRDVLNVRIPYVHHLDTRPHVGEAIRKSMLLVESTNLGH